ncbi:hypothetical protein WDW86_10270 [Bdellovibrionota bacterium FG-2]
MILLAGQEMVSVDRERIEKRWSHNYNFYPLLSAFPIPDKVVKQVLSAVPPRCLEASQRGIGRSPISFEDIVRISLIKFYYGYSWKDLHRMGAPSKATMMRILGQWEKAGFLGNLQRLSWVGFHDSNGLTWAWVSRCFRPTRLYSRRYRKSPETASEWFPPFGINTEADLERYVAKLLNQSNSGTVTQKESKPN